MDISRKHVEDLTDIEHIINWHLHKARKTVNKKKAAMHARYAATLRYFSDTRIKP